MRTPSRVSTASTELPKRSPLVARGAQRQAEQIANAVLAKVLATGKRTGGVAFKTALTKHDSMKWGPGFRASVFPLLEQVGIRIPDTNPGIIRTLQLTQTGGLESWSAMLLTFDVDLNRLADAPPKLSEAAAAVLTAVAHTKVAVAKRYAKRNGAKSTNAPV